MGARFCKRPLDERLISSFALNSTTNWGLSNSLGTGRGDAFEVGTYGINWFGPAYVAGALSFTNNWFTTNRSAVVSAELFAIGAPVTVKRRRRRARS